MLKKLIDCDDAVTFTSYNLFENHLKRLLKNMGRGTISSILIVTLFLISSTYVSEQQVLAATCMTGMAMPGCTPPAPTGISGNASSSTSVSLSWTAPPGPSGAPVTSATYTIYRATLSSGPFTTAVGTSTTTSFIDSGLTPNTTYYYEITVTNAGSVSPLSSTVELDLTNTTSNAQSQPSTSTCMTGMAMPGCTPPAPTGISGNASSSTSVSLSWTAPPGPSGAPVTSATYTIYRATLSSGPFTTAVGTSTTTSFIDSGLTPNTTYYYEITVTNAGSVSPLSSTVELDLTNTTSNAQSQSTNPNLFVSAENSEWENYFAGPQVIQVIVSDPDISRLDESYGEPIVTVNGHLLRMAQATDGNWYAYFADRNQAINAANTAVLTGKGLNFGGFCSSSSSLSPAAGVSYADTVGFTIARGGYLSTNSTNGKITSSFPSCNNTPGDLTSNQMEHVVRENKTLNTNPSGFNAGVTYQQIWPVIQLYDLSATPTPVAVDYQKNGGDQIVNLIFDRIPSNLISTSVDRDAYPTNAQVFFQINDPQLNIDPTDEDSWTWATSATGNGLYYQAFDKDGNPDADGTPAMQNLIGNLTSMMFNHNGILTITPKAQNVRVIDFQDNNIQIYKTAGHGVPADPVTVATNSIPAGSQPLTMIEEGGSNTGVFGDWDGSDKSDIVTPNDYTIRGQSATVKYNDISTSIVGGFQMGMVMQTAPNDGWASGQRIPVTLNSVNDNKNNKIVEQLNLWDPAYTRMPTMMIGTPFSLNSGGGPPGMMSMMTGNETAALVKSVVINPTATSGIETLSVQSPGLSNATATNDAEDEGFSARPIFTYTDQFGGNVFVNNSTGLFIDLKTTMSTLKRTIHYTNNNASNIEGFKGFNFFNYDLRSFSTLNGANGTISNIGIYLAYTTPGANLTNEDGLPYQVTLVSIANDTNLADLINLNGTTTNDVTGSPIAQVANPALLTHNLFAISNDSPIGLLFVFYTPVQPITVPNETPIVADFFSVGLIGDGTLNSQRIDNGVYRYELEETDPGTGIFTGSNQYVMLNQVNIFDPNTYSALRPISHDVYFPAIQDMLQSEGRAPQISYVSHGQDGMDMQMSSQLDIPTHTGVISFDRKAYKVGDMVTVTLQDPDLNTNNDLVIVYTAVKPTGFNTAGTKGVNIQDNATDTIGVRGMGQYSDDSPFGRLVDIEFGQQDIRWTNAAFNSPLLSYNVGSCWDSDSNMGTSLGYATSLSASGFSLVETAAGSGIFQGTFDVPDQVCQFGLSSKPVSTVGMNMKVNYVDFRDDSSKLVEVSDEAGIEGNTGSVKFDKAVYPVPFGGIQDANGIGDFPQTSATSESGVFPLHRDLTENGLTNSNTLPAGDVIVHIRVNDPDYTLSSMGTNTIAVGYYGPKMDHGVVAVQITRGNSSLLLATAGGPTALPGTIVNLNGTSLPASQTANGWGVVRELGPMTEITPGAGIFQTNLPIRYTDGPQGSDCPTAETHWTPTDGTSGTAENNRFHTIHSATTNPSAGFYCVRQGDILTVTYTDLSDASGHMQTVTDSATFDLRNGLLQTDKSVYLIGSDMVLTLVDPEFDLDSENAGTVPLDLIEWDSHAYKGTMGPLGGQSAAFDAKPSTFVETGKDTGIFQAVIKIPEQLGTTQLELGEQINLEYTDWSPAGSKIVGSNSQDIELTIYTSNFGATVELDQKLYSWTDRVYITVIAPDHNSDPNLIDTIGLTDEDQVIVSTRGHQIYYQLSETGADTGIFTGYVILTGDPTLKGTGGVDGEGTEPTGLIGTGTPGSCSASSPCGPTDGFLPAEDSDGVSVSFEFTRDQTVAGSALIRWNVGEVSWLQSSYPANGQGVLQIVDPDMSINPKAINKFDTNVWSDSDSGGIKLTMTETGQGTGIFQGTVYFTTNFQSSGNRLHVSEGDAVTGEYDDRTLPPPYTTADDLRMTATTFIGTAVPPLERAPATNPRIVDSFGNAINGTVQTGQQIQVTADLSNGQTVDQPFAYLVQIQNANGVTVSLSWITGTLAAGQSINPAQSWTPSTAGTYTAQIFVWQSISNPNALSPPLSTTINVE